MSQPPKITLRSLGLIGLLGSVGGAINGWLCYTTIQVPVQVLGAGPETAAEPMAPAFSWYIVPVGAAHGGLLASVSVSMAVWLFKRHRLLRIAGVPLTGWLAGWLSFIPVGFSAVMSLAGIQAALSASGVWEALVWPSHWSGWESFWQPYLHFGFVGALYYLFLNLCRQLSQKRLPVHLLIGSLSGSLGSLLWWIEQEPWYFSLIQGTIWGSLVGFGVWRVRGHGASGVD